MAAPTRWCFVIEAHPAADALLRVLHPFAVQGAELVEVTLARAGEVTAIRIEAEALAADRAEMLLRRLQALPAVRRVGLGWRTPALEAAA